MQNKQYFYLKVGFGNSLLDVCRDPHDHAIGTEARFWIGFRDVDVKELDTALAGNEFLSGNEIKKYVKAKQADLLNLHVFTQDKHKESVRFVTFSKTHLEIWEPTGKLAAIQEHDCKTMHDRINNDIALRTHVAQCFDLKKGVDLSQRNIADDKLLRGAKILPAKRVAKIERSALIPTLNSISVFRSLSSGTCRRMASIDASRQKHLFKFNPVFSKPIKFPFYDGTENWCEEMAYGQFIRLSLDYYSGVYGPEATLAEVMGEANNEKSLVKLILNTLNPAQMETLALLLSLDLGFTPEIGFANALDHIDIRARWNPDLANGRQAITQAKIIRKIFKISETNALEANSNLQRGIILIQCKDYKHSEMMLKGGVFVLDTSNTEAIYKILTDDYADSGNTFTQTKAWLRNLIWHFTTPLHIVNGN